MTVVVNATPLISLAILGHLDLLRKMFIDVVVPSAVYEEVVEQGAGRSGEGAVAEASWLRILTPTANATIEPLLLGLDAGEMQVLLLARELHPEWVLIDEKLGRSVARAMGFSIKGTLGVLLAAVLAELLSKEQALEGLQMLLTHDIWIASRWQAWFKKELDKV